MGKPVITKDWKMRQLVERNALASAVDITAPECKHGTALQWIRQHINQAPMYGKHELVSSQNTD